MPYTTYGLLKTLRSHQISVPSVASTLQTGRPNACNLCHLDRTLEWSADWLKTWFGEPTPELNEDDRRLASGLRWLLGGDAGQRAIAAQAMAWPPAQQASGTWWMAPFLAGVGGDPYEAVRHIATRTLEQLIAAGAGPPDVSASGRQAIEDRVLGAWKTRSAAAAGERRPELLIQPDGTVDLATIRRLVDARDNRPMFLRE
jgi:hypothetical protein